MTQLTPAGSAEATTSFGPGAQSAGAARRFVSATLQAWGRNDLDDVATLLVSELVSNVVLHAGTRLVLFLRRSDERVRIEVHDGSQRMPVRRYYPSTSTSGRGLLLIEELSLAWGAEPTGTGKAVWFELGETSPSGAEPIG